MMKVDILYITYNRIQTTMLSLFTSGYILIFFGFDVWGLDVPEFLTKNCVQKRARDANVALIEVANLENLDSLAGLAENAFDVIYFTKILEPNAVSLP